MRTRSQILVARQAYRVPNSFVVLGIITLAGALAARGGVPLRIVLPMAIAGLVVVVITAARRLLRQASARIRAILSEELGTPPDDGRRCRPDYSSLVARAGLDDAELRRSAGIERP